VLQLELCCSCTYASTCKLRCRCRCAKTNCTNCAYQDCSNSRPKNGRKVGGGRVAEGGRRVPVADTLREIVRVSIASPAPTPHVHVGTSRLDDQTGAPARALRLAGTRTGVENRVGDSGTGGKATRPRGGSRGGGREAETSTAPILIQEDRTGAPPYQPAMSKPGRGQMSRRAPPLALRGLKRSEGGRGPGSETQESAQGIRGLEGGTGGGWKRRRSQGTLERPRLGGLRKKPPASLRRSYPPLC